MTNTHAAQFVPFKGIIFALPEHYFKRSDITLAAKVIPKGSNQAVIYVTANLDSNTMVDYCVYSDLFKGNPALEGNELAQEILSQLIDNKGLLTNIASLLEHVEKHTGSGANPAIQEDIGECPTTLTQLRTNRASTESNGNLF